MSRARDETLFLILCFALLNRKVDKFVSGSEEVGVGTVEGVLLED